MVVGIVYSSRLKQLVWKVEETQTGVEATKYFAADFLQGLLSGHPSLLDRKVAAISAGMAHFQIYVLVILHPCSVCFQNL